MRLQILSIGKLKCPHTKALEAEYIKRLSLPLTLTELPHSKHESAEASSLDESNRLLAALPENSFLVALDPLGKMHSSPEFAGQFQSWQESGKAAICFVIGGSHGLTDTVRTRADKIASFGAMTWPHRLARLMRLEQLYRAQQILLGHPYHK